MNWLSQIETLELIPTGIPQAGTQFALIQPLAITDANSQTLTYETEFDFAPNAVEVALQVAMRDVDSEYQTVDTNSSAGLVNVKTVSNIRALFARLVVVSMTAGSATKMVAKILA